MYIHRVHIKGCHWFFRCNFYRYRWIFITFCAQFRKKNAKVLGVRISCHSHAFVSLLLYRVKVSDTKITHFSNLIDKTNKTHQEFIGSKCMFKISTIHMHMHSNDYGLSSSLCTRSATASILSSHAVRGLPLHDFHARLVSIFLIRWYKPPAIPVFVRIFANKFPVAEMFSLTQNFSEMFIFVGERHNFNDVNITSPS